MARGSTTTPDAGCLASFMIDWRNRKATVYEPEASATDQRRIASGRRRG